MDDVLRTFVKELNLSYDEHEYFRDLVKKHGAVNWRDALGMSQVISKFQVISVLKKLLKKQDTIILVGGWIGLIPYLMEREHLSCERLINIELDQTALAACDALNRNTTFPIELVYEDALKFNYRTYPDALIINTSTEHFGNYQAWLSLIPKGSKCILQNNDMFHVPDHVNCFRSLSGFIAASGLIDPEASEFEIGDGWKRFMLTGVK